MENVYDIANFFISMTNREEDGQITNLKLNKLLYYAQGCSLARTGTRLFEENIEAWQLGPVIPSVYRKYKVCGKNQIQTVDEEYDESKFNEETLDILLDVLEEVGCYTGSALVAMTHREGAPWSQVYDPGKRSTVIPDSMMRDYFLNHPVPSFSDIFAKKIEWGDIEVADAFPADWYDPAEDDEWEACRNGG